LARIQITYILTCQLLEQALAHHNHQIIHGNSSLAQKGPDRSIQEKNTSNKNFMCIYGRLKLEAAFQSEYGRE
jgi:nucleoside-diphosphate-sugar epimerase